MATGRLKREKQLPLEEALRLTREIADGLGYAHSLGIVHRDVKPENILLSGGHAVLADFGIARAVRSAGTERITAMGLAVGTPAYMSPEQASGEWELGAPSDVYSLGCVLYEMLVGEPPFTGVTPEVLLARKAMETVPSLRVVRETVPVAVEAAVMKALARVSADRFVNATRFGEALEPGAVAEAVPPGVVGRRHGWRVAVAAVVAGAALAVVWWAFAGSGAATARIESLVVLPFDNLTGDSAQEYFVEGMHEAVIGDLGLIGALRVISRRSAMHFKGTTSTVLEIARELKVDAVLEGSVFRVGDSVRIQVQLIQAAPRERQLWSESYDRDVRNVLALQAEVARAVAGEIEVALSSAERVRIELAVRPGGTRRPDPQAYDAYLKGRYNFARGTDKGLRAAIRYYEEAIATDSTFAEAYAALAEVLLHPLVEEFERGGVAARTALHLDPDLPEAHVALGIERMRKWDWAASEAEFQRALELNPSSAMVHGYYAQLLRVTMRSDEALAEARRAAVLDPLSLATRTKVGWALVDQHRYREAFEVWAKVLDMEPEFGLAIYNKGVAYAIQGKGEDAIAAVRRSTAVRLPMPGLGPTLTLGVGYALTGQRDRTVAILQDWEALGDDTYSSFIAILYHALGDNEKALDWLERAYELRQYWLPNLFAEGWFDDLRDRPRFQALRAGMGFP